MAMEQGLYYDCTRCGHEEAAPLAASCGPHNPARLPLPPETPNENPQLLPECAGHSSRTSSASGNLRLSSSSKHRVWRAQRRGRRSRTLSIH